MNFNELPRTPALRFVLADSLPPSSRRRGWEMRGKTLDLSSHKIVGSADVDSDLMIKYGLWFLYIIWI